MRTLLPVAPDRGQNFTPSSAPALVPPSSLPASHRAPSLNHRAATKSPRLMTMQSVPKRPRRPSTVQPRLPSPESLTTILDRPYSFVPLAHDPALLEEPGYSPRDAAAGLRIPRKLLEPGFSPSRAASRLDIARRVHAGTKAGQRRARATTPPEEGTSSSSQARPVSDSSAWARPLKRSAEEIEPNLVASVGREAIGPRAVRTVRRRGANHCRRIPLAEDRIAAGVDLLPVHR